MTSLRQITDHANRHTLTEPRKAKATEATRQSRATDLTGFASLLSRLDREQRNAGTADRKTVSTAPFRVMFPVPTTPIFPSRAMTAFVGSRSTLSSRT